ncbi:hypothetical protein ABIA33_000523 [Streptacidiphilus sp. MAP12-16]|uniref:ParH-like protein n=1 Tax=Streptacidiphilus sp. MAP12-16 TaxID=3156300 RepID=UPI003513E52C
MHSYLEHRRLSRRCRRLAQSLTLPSPFDADAFIASTAERLGRRIELIPVETRPSAPCGLLVTTDDCAYILYAADTSPLHQRQILLHEAAHLICNHASSSPDPAARLVLPHLSPALITHVLGRTVYTEPQEREAELLASFVLRRTSREELTPHPPSTSQLRLGAAFGTPIPQRRARD